MLKFTNKLISILGPTASGKTAMAVELAQMFNAEIVSCDSMMVYKGLSIGTAKPTDAEMKNIPHHLIDILELNEKYNAKLFCDDADRLINEIFSRNKNAILCGGSGLYARALLYGFDMRASDESIAADIQNEYQNKGHQAVYDELAAVDKDFADKVTANPRHLTRAVEILRITGKIPDAVSLKERPAYACPEIILMPEPNWSRGRIRQRTEAMLNAGWIEETKRALENNLSESPTALQALGYSSIIEHLNGNLTIDELNEKIVIATSQYAKRQRTWFRNQHPDGIRIDIGEADSPAAILLKLSEIIENF
ncbi:MAG: tRNA (adenosine(37)-N6)-dimethylallyltransferase MiaA [Lentisphaeria bacterium]|nr:tRNA (adenosine(37)-N6)-dimethylallyltransferase MiaA [Lentisphaeria bacterium]NQZ68039.1 tRNA (adenosine(37)-N6)-dimethylallyltransferase MiaA [Lentisphaeria bacterium]